MQPVYIALGANLGNRKKNLSDALTALSKELTHVKQSSIYETEPWGYLNQPRFLNMVAEIDTSLLPKDLLSYLKDIETQMGRQETFKNGPRIIDLDILFYGDCIINTKELVIPHPRIQERGFVLVPLNEIAKGFIHPVLKLTVQEMLSHIDHNDVRLYKDKEQ